MSSSTSDERLASYLRRFSPSPSRDPDAGLRALHHYERRLPRWRYKLRQWLIPVVRWETPYLARMQAFCRSNLLDSYFAIAANLGTHTFFLTFLPICFWCGYPDFGIALVQVLAIGVSLSCALKDLVCLPRPLSPPLQRITMSGSTALEYGFPSTHTTNAVSVALFGLYELFLFQHDFSSLTYGLLRFALFWYAFSITLGRMYCGMHGFFDVIAGAVLGIAIGYFRIIYGTSIDLWIIHGNWTHPVIAVAILALAVRFHPEPADNCPCFDDSVAFLGVLMGTSIGTWHNARLDSIPPTSQTSLAHMYPYSNDNVFKIGGRLLGGIFVIFLWRATMKPLLLKWLPMFFRFVDRWGLMIPRRYFLQARDYTSVPPLKKDDNVLPRASDIPSMLSLLRYPRRRRISVGPQSEADAREYLANRQQKHGKPRSHNDTNVATRKEAGSIMVKPSQTLATTMKGPHLLTPPTNEPRISSGENSEDESREQEMFSAIQKPRTHYDVEVVTKLIVYAGIAWLTVEGNPIWFERLGLV